MGETVKSCGDVPLCLRTKGGSQSALSHQNLDYGNEENAWHNNRGLYSDVLREAGGFWRYHNDSDIIEADRKKRRWADFAAAMSDMIK